MCVCVCVCVCVKPTHLPILRPARRAQCQSSAAHAERRAQSELGSSAASISSSDLEACYPSACCPSACCASAPLQVEFQLEVEVPPSPPPRASRPADFSPEGQGPAVPPRHGPVGQGPAPLSTSPGSPLNVAQEWVLRQSFRAEMHVDVGEGRKRRPSPREEAPLST